MEIEKAKSLLSYHGTCRPQPSSDWTGNIPLAAEIADFYRDVGPDNITIETGANPIFVPSLAKLWERQAGYRWNGLTKEAIDDWNPEWIVVADEGADPYVFYRGRILFAYHGSGSWDFHDEYPDIVTMASGLASKSYDDEEDDDDWEGENDWEEDDF